MILNIHHKTDRYEIVELLHTDRGGYREVYKGIENDGSPVILIAYANDLIKDEGLKHTMDMEFELYDCMRTSTFLRFRKVDETRNEDGLTVRFAVLEYVACESLEHVLAKGKLRTEDAWGIFKSVVMGLNELNFYIEGACHFNICPSTVYVHYDEQGKAEGLLGGLQFVSNDYKNHSNVDINLLDRIYSAPETCMGTLQPESMTFSLALLLATMLQGFHPWKMDTDKNGYIAFIRMRRSKPTLELPKELAECIRKALSPDRGKRYKTLTDFVNAVMCYSGEVMPNSYECFGQTNPKKDTKKKVLADTKKKKEEVKIDDDAEDMDQHNNNATEPKSTVKFTQKRGEGFKAVAGMESLKKELRRDFIDVVNNQDMAKRYKIQIPNLLFYGIPGTGKTYLAERLSEEIGMDYSLIKPSDFANIYVHGGQSLIRQLFDNARKQARKNKRGVLLVFDEVDAVCPQRTVENRENQAGEVAEMLTQLNNCTNDHVYCIGTTNCLSRIDKAIMRTGRFDRIIYFGLPDKDAREALFNYELSVRPHADDINMTRLATLTEGFTASDITYIVGESARVAFEKTIQTNSQAALDIDQSIIEGVIAQSTPSVSASDLRDYERMRDEYVTGKSQQRRNPIGFNAVRQ